jgi:hypothetical protein
VGKFVGDRYQDLNGGYRQIRDTQPVRGGDVIVPLRHRST